MLRDRYEPMDLFAFVPKLSLAMDPVLTELDRLLEDDVVFQRVRADLAKRYPQTLTRGRPSTPVEVILRMHTVKHLYGWSYEETEHWVNDSLVLRQFCRLYLESVPDDTVLIRWAQLIGEGTLAQLNDRVVAMARALKVTRGRKLRVDSTVVETNIHHPTDSRVLGDGVRVLSRLLRRAKKVIGEAVDRGPEVFRTRTRTVRRLTQQIHRIARRKGEEAAEQMKGSYAQLIKVAKASRAQAQEVCEALRERAEDTAQQLVGQFEHFLPLVERAIEQAKRRVIDEQAVPATEKILSLFEPHTQIIVRHKAGKAVEFGHKVFLDEVEGGIISRYEILQKVDPDHEHVEASLQGHQQRFERAPDLLAGDRGCYSAKNERLAQQAGVKRVVLPKTGRLSPERQEYEKQRWFRRGMRFRSGSEGRISVLKRCYGLDCCLNHGEDGFGRWVGWGILTANLARISRTVAARQAQ